MRVYDPLTGDLAGGGLGERFVRPFGADLTGSVFVGTDELAGTGRGRVSRSGRGDGRRRHGKGQVFSGADGSVLYNLRPFGADFEGGARVAWRMWTTTRARTSWWGAGAGSRAGEGVQRGHRGAAGRPLGSVQSVRGWTLAGCSSAPARPPVCVHELDLLADRVGNGQVVRFSVTVSGSGPPP